MGLPMAANDQLTSSSTPENHLSSAIQSLACYVNNMVLLQSTGDMKVAKDLLPYFTKAMHMLAKEKDWQPFNITTDSGMNVSAPIISDCWELVAMGVIIDTCLNNE